MQNIALLVRTLAVQVPLYTVRPRHQSWLGRSHDTLITFFLFDLQQIRFYVLPRFRPLLKQATRI